MNKSKKSKAADNDTTNGATDGEAVETPTAAADEVVEPGRITSVVEVEIIKPLGDMTWTELGRRLQDMQSLSHRLCNDAITACMLNDTKPKRPKGDDGKPAPLAEGQEAADFQQPPQTVCYQSAAETLKRERAYWQGAAQKSAKALSAAKTDEDKKKFGAYLAHAERMGTIDLPGSIKSRTTTLAFERYKKWRKESARGEESLPSFKSGAPIYLRYDSLADLVHDEHGYAVTLKLFEGYKPTHFRVAIAPSGGSAHATMRSLVTANSGHKRHDAKIISRGRGKNRKWLMQITISKVKEKGPPRSDVAVALHLGIRNAITLCASTGQGKVLDTGSDVLHKKGQFRARRADLAAHRKMLGTGARGRGESRRSETMRKLEDSEARWIKTTCQQWAAAVVGWAFKYRASTIVIEDYSPRDLAENVELAGDERSARLIRRWPFAQLRASVEWAAKKAGLDVRVVPAAYESVTCPQCGCIDAANDGGKGVFLCTKCELKRNVDHVAAWNLLRAAGFGGFKEHAAAVKKLTETLRDSAAE